MIEKFLGFFLMNMKLPAHPPFSLSSVIHSHGWARLAPFQLDEDEEELNYVYHLKKSQVIKLNIKEIADGVKVGTQGEVNQNDQAEITAAVTWMLALNEDFSEFYQLTRNEPKLRHVEEKAQGRLLRSPTLFEDTIKTILTTNTSWAGTIRMTESLVTQFGDPLPESDGEFSFPNPERIASSNEQTLRDETRLGYRAPYILDLARKVNAGTLDLEALKTGEIPSEELHKQLTSIKGIGNYAAANLMMLLGYYEYLTIDSWAIKMVSQEFFNGESIEPKIVEEVFEPWGKWKGLAYWLWDWSEK
jgi:3-methyladenine DNA glycosylase/8-oxoguanine DNA glycosylase